MISYTIHNWTQKTEWYDWCTVGEVWKVDVVRLI